MHKTAKHIHRITVIIVFLALGFSLDLSLSAKGVDSLFFDARGSFHQEVLDGKYSARFRAEHINFNIFGHITDKLTYRMRQRLNVWGDTDDPFRATDWLCLSWQATPKFRIYAGKTAVLIGGYEYDAAVIDVYYYSRFCSGLDQGYAFGVNMEYAFMPGQSLIMQVANSPLSIGFQNQFGYNLAWSGGFTKWWKTIWSLNFVEDDDHRFVNFLALGNHFIFNKVTLDIDIFNRAGIGQKNFFFTDFSAISKVIWNIGKWNICTKFGYEMNDAANVNAEGKAYDTVIAPGTESFYWGCGLEYFPLNNDKARLHLTYFTNTFDRIHNIQLGLKWRFDIIGNK